jgi:hypothetical protein
MLLATIGVLLWGSVIAAFAQLRSPWGLLAVLAYMGLTGLLVYWPGIHWL